MSDNLIKFDPELKKPWLKRKCTYDGCRHRSVIVDDGSRIVSCDSCEAILDPISVLKELAKDERVLYYSAKELSNARTLLYSLKQEEKRIKNRITYAKKKGARECDVAENCVLIKTLTEENYQLRRKLSEINRNKPTS